MRYTTRRTFLRTAAAAAGAAGAAGAGAAAVIGMAPAVLRADESGGKAGEKKSVALIGAGWWGTNILSHALADGRVKVVALCDVDQDQLKKCGDAIAKLTSDSPKSYGDYRELLERERPQIVINATPDHWHALITIAAVRSGAHVYVEKPIAHTILEGAAMVRAARETDRVVQVGTHRRVSPHNLSAREFVRAGKIGKIGAIKCFVHSGGGGGPEKPQANDEPPPGLDWNFYCGPAPLRKFNRKIHPLGHRHFLDFANGQLGDWGIHWIDQVMWIMDPPPAEPRTVFSTGGRPIKGPAINSDAGQTTDAPDHQIVAYDFADFTLTWEHRQFGGGGGDSTLKHQPIGVHFYGTEGTLHLGWLDGWTFYPRDAKAPPVHEDARFSGEQNSENIVELWRDFLEAIEQKRRPACDIEGGHRATAAALLGMLSMKLGRSVKWDGTQIVGDAEAAALMKRPYRAPWVYPT